MFSRLSRYAVVVALSGSSSVALAQNLTPATGTPVQNQPVAGQTVRPAQSGRPGQGNMQPGQMGIGLNAFIVHKLKRGNEAEVELGKMASENAKSDSVKEFADMMVKHHTEMIRKLDEASASMGGAGGEPRGAREDNLKNRNARPGDNDTSTNNTSGGSPSTASAEARQIPRGRDNVRNSNSNTDAGGRDPGSAGTGVGNAAGAGSTQASSVPGTASGATVAGTQTPAINAPSTTGGQPGVAGDAAQGRGRGMGNRVPQQLVAITDQACDNELQLTKEMLQKHKGEDFEMAYIGQQIVAHTCMLAHLQAIKSSGPQDLQQLVSEGEKVTKDHLDRAMKIAMELDDDSDDDDSDDSAAKKSNK